MKSKTHIHVVNLIRNELINHSGYIVLYYKDKKHRYRVPDHIYTAINKYPNYLRAGAVGPDFFPDIFFGQTTIHPNKSGIWLERMFDVLKTYTPANKDYYPAWAFYLGYLSHYATDMFGHEDINKYANGYFPAIMDIIEAALTEKLTESEKVRRMVLHMAIESYMDSKLDPAKESFEIQVPIDFVRKCFATPETLEFMKTKGIQYNTSLKTMNILAGLTENYSEAIAQAGMVGFNIRTIERREEYIIMWLKEWETFAQIDINEGFSEAYDRCSDNLLEILCRYLLEMVHLDGVADVIDAFSRIFGSVGDILLSITTLGINKIADGFSTMTSAILKQFFLAGPIHALNLILDAYHNDEEVHDTKYSSEVAVLKRYFKDPCYILNKSKFAKDLDKQITKIYKEGGDFFNWCFKNKYTFSFAGKEIVSMPAIAAKYMLSPKVTDYFDFKWGNFSKEDDPLNQTYLQFERCINMTKLCFIGVNNLNELFYDFIPDFTPNRYRFHGTNYEYGFYRLQASIEMSGEKYAGTNADYFLEVVSNGRVYNYLLDKSGKDDFERGSKQTYNVYLPHFFKASEVDEVILRRGGKGAGDAYFKSITVTDLESGLLVARSTSNFSLNKQNDQVVLELSKNLDSSLVSANKDANPYQSSYISGLYLYHEDPIGGLALGMFMLVTTKDGSTTKLNAIADNKKNSVTRGTVYFPIAVDRANIEKIELVVMGNITFKKLYLYDAANFYLISSLTNPHGGMIPPYLELPLNVTYDDSYNQNGKSGWSVASVIVIVKTAATSKSGSNDDFYLNVVTTIGDPIKVELKNAINNFECDQIDTFYCSLGRRVKVSEITKIELIKEKISDMGDYTNDTVTVIDAETGQTILYHSTGGLTTMKGNQTLVLGGNYWKNNH